MATFRNDGRRIVLHHENGDEDVIHTISTGDYPTDVATAAKIVRLMDHAYRANKNNKPKRSLRLYAQACQLAGHVL